MLLVAAAKRPEAVSAVVLCGRRPDLAGEALSRVAAPTLLIVGGEDEPVIDMSREAFAHLRAEKKLEVVPGVTHFFEEPGHSKKSPGSPPDGLRATSAKERGPHKRDTGYCRKEDSYA